MGEITTNRELYFAVLQLIEQHRENTRSLEEYLRALWNINNRYHDQKRTSLIPDEFFNVLAEAFVAEPFLFDDETWLDSHDSIYALGLSPQSGYLGWEKYLARQVIDLREMAANGQLEDKFRYVGIDSPRGSRWYNFTPGGFLERAMTGTFTGCDWNEDDPDLEVTVLGEISWEQFRDFLGAGQWYE
jgi:hypothetical protein